MVSENIFPCSSLFHFLYLNMTFFFSSSLRRVRLTSGIPHGAAALWLTLGFPALHRSILSAVVRSWFGLQPGWSPPASREYPQDDCQLCAQGMNVPFWGQGSEDPTNIFPFFLHKRLNRYWQEEAVFNFRTVVWVLLLKHHDQQITMWSFRAPDFISGKEGTLWNKEMFPSTLFNQSRQLFAYMWCIFTLWFCVLP